MIALACPWLLLLLPLPLLAARLLPPSSDGEGALRVPFLDRVAPGAGTQPGVPRGERGLRWTAWACVVLALARPQWIEDPVVQERALRDLLVAVDLSVSMDSRDFDDASGQPVTRLEAVRELLGAFLAQRRDDRVGLVVFGSAAFVHAPFTQDPLLLRQLLDETAVGMAGPRTMLGDAIGLAITLFDRSELPQKVLVLLTDGNDTGSQVPPQRAAEIARDRGIVIHAIGVGDPRAAGEEALDEDALRAVAESTGGRYFRAADRAALEQVYAELDRITPRAVETRSHRPRRELFHWPLGAALLAEMLWLGARLAAQAYHRRRAEDGA